jgi:hypothetical protein
MTKAAIKRASSFVPATATRILESAIGSVFEESTTERKQYPAAISIKDDDISCEICSARGWMPSISNRQKH